MWAPIRSWLGRLRTPVPAGIAVCIAVFGAVVGARSVGWLQPLELAAYDRFLAARPAVESSESPITLIRILESDVSQVGYPICDEILDDVVQLLLAAGAASIGVDLYRDVPVPYCAGPNAESCSLGGYGRIAATVNGTDRVIMAFKLSAEPIEPPRFVESPSRLGFTDVPTDGDGIVRRILLILHRGDQQYFSLALRVALQYLEPAGVGLSRDPSDASLPRLGPASIPILQSHFGGYANIDAGGYQTLLDFKDYEAGFPSISLSDLLSGSFDRDVVRGKVVLIGTTATSVPDFHDTPYSRMLGGNTMSYGVELHALAASQLIRWGQGMDLPLEVLGVRIETIWILLWAVMGTALALARVPFWIAGALALGSLGFLVVGSFLVFLQGWWIPVVPSLAALLLSASLVIGYRAFYEIGERSRITRLFSRFLRPQVADRIWQQREEFMSEDENGRPRPYWTTLTVLMCDVQGFASLSESLHPSVLMAWVNEYLQVMADIIEQHGGVVDDYAGDGLRANFGFPEKRTRPSDIEADAKSAVRCALVLETEIEKLNASWRERGLPEARVRVGIATGPAVAGAVGGTHSLKYTAVGDTVNTAARLESFDKDAFRAEVDGPSIFRILVTAETSELLGREFLTEDQGVHPLRGMREPVGVLRVVGTA